MWTINNNAIRENGIAAGSTIHLGGLSGTGGTIYMENGGAPIILQIGERNDPIDSYAGVVGQNASFLKSGTGTELFSGANTYTGGTTVSSGTLIGTSTTAFGIGAVTVGSGGTLDYNAAGNNALTIKSLTLADGSTIGGSLADCFL